MSSHQLRLNDGSAFVYEPVATTGSGWLYVTVGLDVAMSGVGSSMARIWSIAVAEYVDVCTSRRPRLPDHVSPARLASRKAEVVFSITSYELVGSREGRVCEKSKVPPLGLGWPSRALSASRYAPASNFTRLCGKLPPEFFMKLGTVSGVTTCWPSDAKVVEYMSQYWHEPPVQSLSM